MIDLIYKEIESTREYSNSKELPPPCILLGNKIDIEDSKKEIKHEGLHWAMKHQMKYFEVSAFDRKSVIGPFVHLTSHLPHETKIQKSTSFTTSIRRRGSQKWRSKKNFKMENTLENTTHCLGDDSAKSNTLAPGGPGKKIRSRKLSMPDQIKSPNNIIDECPQTVSYSHFDQRGSYTKLLRRS